MVIQTLLILTPNSAYLNYGKVTLCVTKLICAFCPKSKLMVFSSHQVYNTPKTNFNNEQKADIMYRRTNVSTLFFVDIIYWENYLFIFVYNKRNSRL